MNQIFKLSATIYQFLLILIIPLLVIAKFLVGAAGHNSEFKISDYILFMYLIIVLALLTFLKKSNPSSTIKIAVRNILLLLIFASIIYEFYALYDIYLLYSNHQFQYGDNISIVVITLIITLSSTLFIGLLKNKIYC